MQRIYIALALALTMSVAFAGYNTTGFVKNPVSVAGDTETNFTTAGDLSLASTNAGELSLVGYTMNPNVTVNTTAFSWNVWLKKVETKALTIASNNSLTYVGAFVAFSNGYIISITTENDTATSPKILRAYQAPITGGAALPRITLGNNTDVNFTARPITYATVGKNLYVFYLAADKKVNVTSFAVGGAASTTEFILTSAYESGLQVVWGEALGSSQVFAAWIEGGVLKDAVVDVSKGSVGTVNAVGSWSNTSTCIAFSTDKKWYGELCSATNTTAKTVVTSVRSNTTGLIQLASYSWNNTDTTLSSLSAIHPYGPYIANFWVDRNGNGKNLSVEIWNLDTFTTVKNKTVVAQFDGTGNYQLARIPAGGLYALLWNTGSNGTNFVGIQVGQVLSGSYLASVLGFIMTIVAGLFLF